MEIHICIITLLLCCEDTWSNLPDNSFSFLQAPNMSHSASTKGTKNHKNHHERDRQSRTGAAFEDPGNELCPLSSFEKHLPKEVKAFYLHPKRGEKLGEVWFSLEPKGVNYRRVMLSYLHRGRNISGYTNHGMRKIQKLAEGGLETKEISQSADTGPRVLPRAAGHLLWITENDRATCCTPARKTCDLQKSAPRSDLQYHLLSSRGPTWTLWTAVSTTVIFMAVNSPQIQVLQQLHTPGCRCVKLLWQKLLHCQENNRLQWHSHTLQSFVLIYRKKTVTMLKLYRLTCRWTIYERTDVNKAINGKQFLFFKVACDLQNNPTRWLAKTRHLKSARQNILEEIIMKIYTRCDLWKEVRAGDLL